MPLCPQISSLALRVGFGPFHIIVTALDIAHDDDGEVHDLHRRQRFRAELGIGQHRILTDAAGQQRPGAAGSREIDRPVTLHGVLDRLRTVAFADHAGKPLFHQARRVGVHTA